VSIVSIVDTLSLIISVINQIDAQNLFYNKFISCLYMFRAYVLIIRRSKLYCAASGIFTPVGGRLVHRLREESPVTHDPRSGSQDHHSSTNWVQKTIRCNLTSSAPDDGRVCPKHVELN